MKFFVTVCEKSRPLGRVFRNCDKKLFFLNKIKNFSSSKNPTMIYSDCTNSCVCGKSRLIYQLASLVLSVEKKSGAAHFHLFRNFLSLNLQR